MKKAHIFFSCCFLIIISLPFIFMDHKNVVSEKENRNLAPFPVLTGGAWSDRANVIRMPKLFDTYINDRFGFKGMAVSLAGVFNRASKTINGNVVIGRNGWLFYSNPNDGRNIEDFFKVNLFTEAEVGRFIENIEKRLEWCNRHNIKFMVLIAPNKHNIYPEQYPFDRPEGITRMGQIMSALPDNLRPVVIYPIDYLLENKRGDTPLYFETDTHWNMAGARHAFDILFDRIKAIFPGYDFPALQFSTDISYASSGDIVPMSGFTSYGRRTIPTIYPQEGWDFFYQYIKNEGTNGVITKNNNQALPRAIIFRDSFFTVLEPFVSTVFSSVEYNWKLFDESKKDYLLENRPDIIIWELVERLTPVIVYSGWNGEN